MVKILYVFFLKKKSQFQIEIGFGTVFALSLCEQCNDNNSDIFNDGIRT